MKELKTADQRRIRVEFEITREDFDEWAGLWRREQRRKQRWPIERINVYLGTIAAAVGFAVLFESRGEYWPAPAALVLFGVGLQVLPWIGNRSSSDAAWERYRQRAEPVVWEFDLESASLQAPHVAARYRWAAFDRVEETSTLFVLYRAGQPTLIPKRAFADARQCDAFRALVAAAIVPPSYAFPVVSTAESQR